MTKEQVLDAVRKMSRDDREIIMHEILLCNESDNLQINKEQEAELNTRISEVSQQSVKLVDGNLALSNFALKNGF